MDFIATLLIVVGYWFFKFRTVDVVESESVQNENVNVIPIGNNLALQKEPQAFEKIVRELKLIK